ncbi:T9SS type A sorting domain-containing protein [Roseivirga pacifica]|uniref:T9SS type A sorting domain-containing protein n=1 Tax=Roseivirga pacifica TaxID=1267423 RepID=UPI00227AB8BE|nr:T9SS type A sorting domain-containing protein [Roseivirga pacifica]
MTRACICIMCLFVYTQTLNAQTGPGGIGNTNGSSDLDIWFDANQLAYNDAGTNLATDGQTVQSWHNLSGSGSTSNASNVTNLPIFTENALNGYPALTFDGVDDLLDFTYTTVGTGSIFLVASGSNPTNVQRRAIRLGGPASNFRVTLGMPAASSFRARLFDGTTATPLSTTVSAATPYVYSYNYSNGSSVELFVNGNLAASNSTVVTGTPGVSGTARISSSALWNGNISEIIHIASGANTAEKIIIENYLAAKYGLSLSTSDIYDEDNDGYDHDVAGIGQAPDGSSHTDSRGTGMVRINGADNLENGEFLFWGHDGADALATETDDIPMGVEARFQRVWRVSEENTFGVSVDVGSVNVLFDLSAFSSVTAADLVLLIDTDNDGTFADETPITGATDQGDGMYQFAGISALTDNTRFTIASADTEQTPLPVVLVSFDVKPTSDNKVMLNWVTTSETDNSHFTIERSKYGKSFEAIAYVDGAGSVEEVRRYQFEDPFPFNGNNYYRLKQTDFNGQFTYSEVEKVIIENNSFNVTFYPNPVNQGDELTFSVQSSDSELKVIVINAQGCIEATHEVTVESPNQSIALNTYDLTPGIYSLLIQASTGKTITKRLIVR